MGFTIFSTQVLLGLAETLTTEWLNFSPLFALQMQSVFPYQTCHLAQVISGIPPSLCPNSTQVLGPYNEISITKNEINPRREFH